MWLRTVHIWGYGATTPAVELPATSTLVAHLRQAAEAGDACQCQQALHSPGLPLQVRSH